MLTCISMWSEEVAIKKYNEGIFASISFLVGFVSVSRIKHFAIVEIIYYEARASMNQSFFNDPKFDCACWYFLQMMKPSQ